MKTALLMLLLALSGCAANTPTQAPNTGKQLAFNRNKGNCLACHVIADGESPGNIGPPLANLASRFKDKQQLHAQIWDARQFNPDTSMPPFGANKILSETELDELVEYLWGL
jgi:sulfur-oxidizing protein SoxX